MKHSDIGPRMRRGEKIGGFCYLPFYVFLLGWLLSLLSDKTGLNLSLAQRNLIYSYINFAAIVVIFRRLLAQSLKEIPHQFWAFLQAMVLGFALYYATNLLLGLILGRLWPVLQNPADNTAIALVENSGTIMLVCAVFLSPMVEETLMRGLIFGLLQPVSRIAAYSISCILFAALHLWQYVGSFDTIMLLGDMLLYLPAGIALAWTYEKAGNLWAPVLLHTFINALSLGAIRLL